MLAAPAPEPAVISHNGLVNDNKEISKFGKAPVLMSEIA